MQGRKTLQITPPNQDCLHEQGFPGTSEKSLTEAMISFPQKRMKEESAHTKDI